MIGRLISGRYHIEAVVGTGGMAVVYRALDTQLNEVVAIKVLRPEYETDMEFVRRFSREAEAAAKMSHENIVNLLDVGIDSAGALTGAVVMLVLLMIVEKTGNRVQDRGP